MRSVITTNLSGAGIRVAQPEASDPAVTNFEVRPTAVGQPVSLFTYYSDGGTATTYPNGVGIESGHADGVAANFYGLPNGVATNVAHVDNYDANYFIKGSMVAGNYVFTLPAGNINDPVVNQSFVFINGDYSHIPTNEEQAVNTAYDNYAAQYNTLFVSGAGNGWSINPTVNAPATSYNGMGVGVSDGASSIGPTIDNGRCKPDIIAPGGATSFSTPLVSGAAAVLMQAGLHGDGGSDTNAASDIRTVKALLLNGAVKPTGWTNSTASPLDARYGAGVLNVFNAYEQLAGGQHGPIESNLVSSGSSHYPGSAAANEPVLSGWDFNVSTSSTTKDRVSHYYFNATNVPGNFAVTATLVWNRQQNQTDINNLDLFLYNCANSNLVACSTSQVDNVEHIFVPQLAPGRYDLQVWKAGGSLLSVVSDSETYALAWAFTSTQLTITNNGLNATLTWPAYPAGFKVETTTNLHSPAWSTSQIPASIFTNGQNVLFLSATNSVQFFRLHQRF